MNNDIYYDERDVELALIGSVICHCGNCVSMTGIEYCGYKCYYGHPHYCTLQHLNDTGRHYGYNTGSACITYEHFQSFTIEERNRIVLQWRWISYDYLPCIDCLQTLLPHIIYMCQNDMPWSECSIHTSRYGGCSIISFLLLSCQYFAHNNKYCNITNAIKYWNTWLDKNVIENCIDIYILLKCFNKIIHTYDSDSYYDIYMNFNNILYRIFKKTWVYEVDLLLCKNIDIFRKNMLNDIKHIKNDNITTFNVINDMPILIDFIKLVCRWDASILRHTWISINVINCLPSIIEDE